VAVDVAVVAVCAVGLWFGARWLVEGATGVARRLGVAEATIGLTVVAVGTSAPEFAVTGGAALAGRGDVAVGNVVGSNLFNLGVVLGLVALFGRLEVRRELVHRDGAALAAAVVALGVFLLDLRLSRVEGVVLLAGLVAYLAVLVARRPRPPHPAPAPRTADGGAAAGRDVDVDADADADVDAGAGSRGAGESGPTSAGRSAARDVLELAGGLVTVLVAANLLVGSAVDLARLLGVSDWVVGVTVVAVGTSLPELATALVAAGRGRGDLSAASLVGSDLFNVLGVLGLAALLSPVTVAPDALPGLAWLGLAVAVALAVLWTGRALTRREGALLLSLALVRWAWTVVG
jgi:cation:H+ antiporter